MVGKIYAHLVQDSLKKFYLLYLLFLKAFEF